MNKRTAAPAFSVQQSFFDSQGVYPPFPVGVHLGKDGPQRLDLGAGGRPGGSAGNIYVAGKNALKDI